MKFPLRPALLALVALLFAGCAGYHIGPIRPKWMDGVQTVAVPTFENETLMPRLEVLAADSLIAQLQQDGTFQVATSDTADAVVQGSVIDIRRHGARSTRSDVLKQREYTLTVTLRYTVTRRSTGELLAKGKSSGVTSFFVSGNDLNQDERQAIPLALSDAALHLVSHLSEGW
jgi:hypothetical protein